MSAVDVQIAGTWYFNLNDWNVQGYSTPTVPGDMTGGAGAMTFGLPEESNSKTLQKRHCFLRDPLNGNTSGDLTLASGNGENASLTGFSKIAKLNVTRTAEAHQGTLRSLIIYYLGLCGVTDKITIESTLASRAVNYIGWEGNVLDYLKDLCAAQDMELSLIGEYYAFRVANKRTISIGSFADWSWRATEDNLAQSVEVAWFRTNAAAEQMIYPIGGWNADVPVFTVDAGAVAEYEIDMVPDLEAKAPYGISVKTVKQPTCVPFVDRNYSGSTSVYAVAGKDGLPITPAQWNAGGGKVVVEVLEAGAKLNVKITGPTVTEYSPYSIAMSAGESDMYSSLRIIGTGVLYRKEILTRSTGLSVDRASQEVAPIVETPFYSTEAAASKAADRLVQKYGGTTYAIDGTVQQVINQVTPAATVYFSGESLEDDPTIHTFGNLEGALFKDPDGMTFRIRSVTYTPNGETFTAEQHIV